MRGRIAVWAPSQGLLPARGRRSTHAVVASTFGYLGVARPEVPPPIDRLPAGDARLTPRRITPPRGSILERIRPGFRRARAPGVVHRGSVEATHRLRGAPHAGALAPRGRDGRTGGTRGAPPPRPRAPAELAPLVPGHARAPLRRAPALRPMGEQPARGRGRRVGGPLGVPQPPTLVGPRRPRPAVPGVAGPRADPGLPGVVQRTAPRRGPPAAAAGCGPRGPSHPGPGQGPERRQVADDPAVPRDGARAPAIRLRSLLGPPPGAALPHGRGPPAATGGPPRRLSRSRPPRLPPRPPPDVRAARARVRDGSGPAEEPLRARLPRPDGPLHRPRRGPHAGRAAIARPGDGPAARAGRGPAGRPGDQICRPSSSWRARIRRSRRSEVPVSRSVHTTIPAVSGAQSSGAAFASPSTAADGYPAKPW